MFSYRSDIDGLRAVAIWAVVIFHAFPNTLRNGFIGVDVFFVISGFLISSIIFKSLMINRFSFVDFYIKRINRIFPALILILIFCIVFGYFSLLPDEYHQLGKHIIGGAGFISNIFLWREMGYFDISSSFKPLLNLWSLGVEEQFYILWPLLIFCIWRSNVKPIIMISIIFCGSFIFQLITIAKYPVMTFYLIPMRCWELLIGAIWAYYAINNIILSNLIKQVLSFVGVLLLVLSFILIKGDKRFPGWVALLPTLGALFIIMAGSGAWFNRYILSNKCLVWFGLISYPLYLWHWPILSFLRIINGDTLSKTLTISAVLLCVVLAALTFYLLEKPLKKVKSNLKTVYMIIIMIMIGCLGLIIYFFNGFPARSFIQRTSLAHSQFVGPIWKYTNNDLCLKKYPFEPAKKYTWWFCMVNRNEAPDILLIGNSYANHLYPGIIKNKKLKQYTTLSIGTCPFDAPDVDINPESNNPCSGNNVFLQKKFIRDIINNNKSIKFVIIDVLSSEQNEQKISRVKELVTYLESRKIQPIIFIPHITIKHDLKRCFSRPFNLKGDSKACLLDIEKANNIDRQFSTLIKELKKGHPSIVIFDQNKLFCNMSSCSLILNGLPIFRDEYSHYSEYASEELINYFVDWYSTLQIGQKPL